MSQDLSAATITSTASVNYDTIPCHDVLKLTSGAGHWQLFRYLRVCMGRMHSRASAEIVGPIRFQLAYKPGVQQAMAVGIIPERADASAIPTTTSAIMANGLSLSSTEYGSAEQSYEFVPGVSTLLTTTTVGPLVGSPPKLYFWGTHNGTGTMDMYLHIRYTLRVMGVGWIDPNHAIYTIPVHAIPTSASSSTGGPSSGSTAGLGTHTPGGTFHHSSGGSISPGGTYTAPP